jgi:hypothetical protein
MPPLTASNAHVTLENTTTGEQYIFRTQVPRPIHKLLPGSYKVVHSSAKVPRDIYFKGNFNVYKPFTNKQETTISPYVPLTSVSPFNMKNPNYLVVSDEEFSGIKVDVTLSRIQDSNFRSSF